MPIIVPCDGNSRKRRKLTPAEKAQRDAVDLPAIVDVFIAEMQRVPRAVIGKRADRVFVLLQVFNQPIAGTPLEKTLFELCDSADERESELRTQPLAIAKRMVPQEAA